MKKKNECDLCQSDSTFFTKLYDLDGFNIMKCKKCNLVFRDVILDTTEANDLYSEKYYVKEQNDYFFKNDDIKVKDFTKRLEDIEKVGVHKGRILDVGCAIGTFLNICRQNGWDAYGQEVSEYAADYAKKQYNLNVSVGALADIKFPDNYFDVVTLWDVIDHCEYPSGLLREVHRILKPGGLIAVQTDMEDSFIYMMAHLLYAVSGGKIKFAVKKGHPLHHTTFYSLSTLKKALQSANFEVVKDKRLTFPSQLVSVRQGGSAMSLIFDLMNSIGNLVNRPLEAVIYGRKQ